MTGQALKNDADHTSRVAIKLNNSTDADILKMLESVPNKQGYIKQLIRDDIARKAGTAQG